MIALRGICRDFQVGDSTVSALHDIDLTIDAGEYLSVMGPSGSGKSTLLNVLGLLDRPDAGEYRLLGESTAHLDEEARARLRREHIGFVFQSYHLVARLSALENIELPLLLAGVERRMRRARVDEILQRLSLTDRASHVPAQLSGGQCQRVAIGRAIAMKPGLILADEPTGNLDSRSGAEVTGLLEELNAEGITLLVVTHDAALGGRAPRRIRMHDGAIVADESHATG